MKGDMWGRCKLLAEFFEYGNLLKWRRDLGIERGMEKFCTRPVEGIEEDGDSSSEESNPDCGDFVEKLL
jgi:hypothetical protein